MFNTVWPSAGTIVYVLFMGGFKHMGVVSDRWHNGKPMIFVNALETRGAAEVSWDRFTAGKPCFIEAHQSSLWPAEVIYNARSMLGRPYHIINFNCQHFAYGCHGETKSPQLAALGVAALLGVMLVAATR